MYIDVAQFRQLFTVADPILLGNKIGADIRGKLYFIKFLFYSLSLLLLLSILFSILAFSWWSILIGPTVLLFFMIYWQIVCKGPQRIMPATVAFVNITIIGLNFNSDKFWLMTFIISLGIMFFSLRLLYYLTAQFAFSLAHSNLEFFNMFYMKPDGAAIPYLWTSDSFDKDT